MTAFRTTTILMLGLIVLFTLSACTREVTYTEETPSSPSNCFECHTDEETFLVSASQQWGYSRHGSGLVIDRNYSSCSGCHTGDGFVAVAMGGEAGNYSNPGSIHCFTCHAPHSTGNLGLRVTAPQELQNGVSRDIAAGNTCVVCHQSRRDVNSYVPEGDVSLNSHWGPHHGPQGDMLFGSNGFEYDGYDYDDMTAHRTVQHPDDNGADGCLNCHYKSTTNFVVGGHSFNMRGAMISEDGAEEVLNTAACWACHEEPDDWEDEFDWDGIQTEIHMLLAQLEGLLFDAGVIDASGHPISGQSVPQGTAGALWNYLMVEEDRSFGVHNPDYMVDLLESAIEHMESLP